MSRTNLRDVGVHWYNAGGRVLIIASSGSEHEDVENRDIEGCQNNDHQRSSAPTIAQTKTATTDMLAPAPARVARTITRRPKTALITSDLRALRTVIAMTTVTTASARRPISIGVTIGSTLARGLALDTVLSDLTGHLPIPLPTIWIRHR